jgi:hypothetical protein
MFCFVNSVAGWQTGWSQESLLWHAERAMEET